VKRESWKGKYRKSGVRNERERNVVRRGGVEGRKLEKGKQRRGKRVHSHSLLLLALLFDAITVFLP
jgi:hypothetical protein